MSEFDEIVRGAITRLETSLAQALPHSAGAVEQWRRGLSGDAPPESYFLHPLAFPSLRLPWWLAHTIAPAPIPALHLELAYSTINGYYYIRLLDNVMDGHATVELGLLPALGFFHSQFQGAYRPLFPAGHPFWPVFETIWFTAADAVIQDAAQPQLDLARFEQFAAQKVSPAKIPLAAVCHATGRWELFAPWAAFVDGFGRWHQFHNDMFDWHKDHTHDTPSYFLSQAGHRRRDGESLTGWVAREGLAWGIDLLHHWLADLQLTAGELSSPPLLAYLAQRQAMLTEQQTEAEAALQLLARLSAAMPE
jgi:hypothetical protein